MDVEKLKELIQILEASQLSEIEIEEDGRRVRLAKSLPQNTQGPGSRYDGIGLEAQEQVAMTLPARIGRSERAPKERDDGLVTIDSPMVGVFYAAPGPGKPPFVSPGDVVEENHTVCIIEAMKLMNEITAKHRIEIVRVLVENGEPVEFGQSLFAVRHLG